MEIFHYTNSEGLLGIIQNKNLWATHYKYLNDESEFLSAKMFIIKIVGESKNQIVQKYKDSFLKCLERVFVEYEIYTCSFSLKSNLLSQWRAYCPNDGGFSIGFDTKGLDFNNLNWIHQCIYKEDEQKRMLVPIIERFCENCEKIATHYKLTFSDYWETQFRRLITCKSTPMNQDVLDDAKNQIEAMYDVAKIAARMKNIEFKEEEEYRIICVSEVSKNGNRINFRKRESLIIPYMIIPIDLDYIKNITLGPSLNKDLNLNSLQLIKRRFNMKFSIKESSIPYRGW